LLSASRRQQSQMKVVFFPMREIRAAKVAAQQKPGSVV
jgi:hypothetical protein